MMNNLNRKIGVVSSALCLSMGLSSCKNSDAKNESIVPHEETTWTPAANDREVGGAMNGFGFRVLQKLDAQKKPDQNVLFSPFSIATALTLVEQGAGGQTRSEMEKLLQPSGFSSQNILDSSAALTRGWKTADAKVEIDIANSLWLRQKYTLKPAFVALAKKSFDAPLSSIDFASPQAAPTINNWVSGKTHNKIKDMVSRETLQNAMMVIVNAVYFHGKWQNPFDKAETQDGDFHRASGTKLRAPMMSQHQEKTFSYAKTDKVALAALPYGKGHLSMIFVLPDPAVPLSQIVAQLDNARWNAWMEAMSVQEGTVKIPRFTLKEGFSLNEILKQLGMPAAFSSRADFSAMTGTPQVFISEVAHKAWMQVDESGTEAAASTSVAVAGAMRAPGKPPFEFTADRPFLAAIRDNRSGNLLFLAEVNQPSQ